MDLCVFAYGCIGFKASYVGMWNATWSRNSTNLIMMPIISNAHPNTPPNTMDGDGKVSSFLTNSLLYDWLSSPQWAQSKPRMRFQRSFIPVSNTQKGHVWNASLFSGIQVLYIYRSRCQKRYTYIHHRYSYLRFSVIYIDKFSVRDEPTYTISIS